MALIGTHMLILYVILIGISLSYSFRSRTALSCLPKYAFSRRTFRPTFTGFKKHRLSIQQSQKKFRKIEVMAPVADTELNNILKYWWASRRASKALLQSLISRKVVFDAENMEESEDFKKALRTPPTVPVPFFSPFADVECYINKGNKTHPIFLKADSDIPDFNRTDREHIKNMMRNGCLFFNVSSLMKDEVLTHRIYEASSKVMEHPVGSDEWAKWTNQTEKYQRTTLTELISEYYRTNCAGDIGDERYVPRRGYEGTLAPGELFEEEDPIEDIVNSSIPHPFGAIQEIPFHVRWPVPRPLIPNPLHWLALNNMLMDESNLNQAVKNPVISSSKVGGTSVTSVDQSWGAREPDLPQDVAIGGYMMRAEDALKIAKYGRIGQCFDPNDQDVLHAGMMTPFQGVIPHYNSTHPPTLPLDEINPDIEDIRPLIDKWYHTRQPLQTFNVSTWNNLTEAQVAEMNEEEEERRRLITGLLRREQRRPDWENVKDSKEKELNDMKAKYQNLYAPMLEQLKESVAALPGNPEIDVSQQLHALGARDVDLTESVVNMIDEQPRSMEELTEYNIMVFDRELHRFKSGRYRLQ